MQPIKIPRFLHELFGAKTTMLELSLTLLVGSVVTIFVLGATYGEWQGIAWWRQVLLAVFALDILGGVVANVTYGTNQYYKYDPKARLLFILIHIQPIIVALLLGGWYGVSVAVTVYTIAAGLVVNALIKHPAQPTVGVSLMFVGVVALLVQGSRAGVPAILLALFAAYIFKVIYSFAVDHFPDRKVSEWAGFYFSTTFGK